MEANVSLRILLHLDVFWASSCLQSIASTRGGSELTLPPQVACFGGVQLIADTWTFLEVQVHYTRQTRNPRIFRFGINNLFFERVNAEKMLC